jgi:hypothetical protein
VESQPSTLRPGERNVYGGKQNWFVPDAFLPVESSHGVTSHESACLLNAGERAANVRFTFFFEDREPIGPVEVRLGARRTWHVRLDDPASIAGVELPRGVPYAYAVESDVPIVVQHSRLDTSAGQYTLFTTIAYGE